MSINEMNQLKAVDGTRYLVFSLGDGDYAIPLLGVREVIAFTETTPLPFSPPYFVGIMNLRGQVISIMDLRKKFNVKPRENAETAVIICDLGDISLGVVVDSVNSVLSADSKDIAEKPEFTSGDKADFVTGVYNKNSKLTLIVDIARALSLDDKATISKTGAKAA